ncbi:MAG: saccharopine dehydrogenase NADP-binding domain-containing protein [Polyangiales bacterium]
MSSEKTPGGSDFGRCLVYGASGYTGELIAERAAELGLRPILAGRSAEKLRPLAERFAMPTRVFGLDDPEAIDRGLADVDVVIHAAGPFSRTSRPMLEACLRARSHYLDITGEISVFEACAARGREAQDAGVMVMPGTGFDVVPSDCLAKHVAQRLPEATELTLAFQSVGGGTSHGTATTMVESLHLPNQVRRDGVIVDVPSGSLWRDIDFGRGPRAAMSIPWGDVSTAFSSTAIPNIAVYIAAPPAARWGAKLLPYAGPLLGSAWVQRALRSRIPPGGPSAEARARSFTLMWAEARSRERRVVSRMRVPEGYTLTARTSVEIARRVLGGDAQPGFRTPSTVFGADFILGFDGVSRSDEP